MYVKTNTFCHSLLSLFIVFYVECVSGAKRHSVIFWTIFSKSTSCLLRAPSLHIKHKKLYRDLISYAENYLSSYTRPKVCVCNSPAANSVAFLDKFWNVSFLGHFFKNTIESFYVWGVKKFHFSAAKMGGEGIDDIFFSLLVSSSTI